MAPHDSARISTDEGPPWDGHLEIEVSQESQDKGGFTSSVLVIGRLINDNDWNVEHPKDDIERHISGTQDYYPSPFHFDIAGHSSRIFIQHTFIVPHDDNGTKTVNFTVHYGQTDTPTFQHDKSVGVSLTLTPMPVGGWVRAGDKWVHGGIYVRYLGKWKPAVAYVRTGGIWKACQ